MLALLRAEWTKVRSHPVAGSAVVLLVVAVPALAMLLATHGGGGGGGSGAGVGSGAASGSNGGLDALLQAARVSQVFAVVLGAAVAGQEFEGGSLRTTYLGSPRRGLVAAAKLLTTLVLTALTTAVGFGLGLGLLAGSGKPAWHGVSVAATLGHLGVALLSMLVLSALALGLAVLTRSLAAAVAILVPLLLGLSQIIRAVTPVGRFLPDLATANAFSVAASGDYLSVGPGFATQLAWVAFALVGAFLLSERRDVK